MTPQEKKRKRDREYYHRNRRRLIDQTLARRQQYIQEAKDHLGGKCVWCGSTDDLEFDHIDDALKLDNVCRVYRKEKSEQSGRKLTNANCSVRIVTIPRTLL